MGLLFSSEAIRFSGTCIQSIKALGHFFAFFSIFSFNIGSVNRRQLT